MPAAAAAAAALLVLIGALAARTASAASVALPYGEVAHFGGFDASGDTPAKFVLPVGFAVEPENPSTHEQNAVYVLDRTVDVTEENAEEEVTGRKLDYRLQKLSSTGKPLGSALLPMQSFGKELVEAHPVLFLAVDPAAKRVYALVEGIINANGGNALPVAQSLVAWSTEPNANKELVPAPGLLVDTTLTGGGVVAGASVLEPTKENVGKTIGEDLYAPEGLAIDPANHDVVIEAQHGAPSRTSGGATILVGVTTEGAEPADVGQRDGEWLAEDAIAPNTEQAGGIFTATVNGTFSGFGIDLYQKKETVSRFAEVNTGLSAAQLIAHGTEAFQEADSDQGGSIDGVSTPNRNSNREGPAGFGDLGIYTAGSPVTELSNGLYAARYTREFATSEDEDVQAGSPWNAKGALDVFWWEGGTATKHVGNVGVRLFDASGHVVTTIGGQLQGQPCNLDFAQMSVAAGADESLFVLTQPNEANGDSNDEVIEFAPTGYEKADACPTAGGEIEVNEAVVKAKVGETIPSATVHVGQAVKFNAASIERHGEAPYEFQWTFAEPATLGGACVEGSPEVEKMQTPLYLWPTPEVEHTYTTPGTCEASVQISGDYGTSTFPVMVEVLGAGKPVAKLDAPSSATEGEKVSFEASGSTPTPGSKIENYHWDFGDGSEPENTHNTKIEHKFAHSGTFTVELKITDKAGNTAEASEKVTVSAAKASGGGTTNPGSTNPGSTNPGSTSSGSTNPGSTNSGSSTPHGGPKELTRAQKLAAALKACKRKPKSQRASCEKQAEKKYGASKKKSKSKKKKK